MSSIDDRAYRLARAELANRIPPRVPGTYVLGKYIGSGFSPIYVGRSDDCLLTRLLTHNHRQEATHVAFRLFPNAQRAFLHECALYHTHEEQPWLLNKVHPASPKLSGLVCPFCSYAGDIAVLDQ